MSPPFNKWRCKEMQVKISSQNFSRDSDIYKRYYEILVISYYFSFIMIFNAFQSI